MKVSHGAMLIAKERTRQVEEEGWTAAHDNNHSNEELALASVCYALDYARGRRGVIPEQWTWDEEYWKPTPDDYIKQLTKAGALIVAEIDRLHKFDELVKQSEKAPKGSFLNP